MSISCNILRPLRFARVELTACRDEAMEELASVKIKAVEDLASAKKEALARAREPKPQKSWQRFMTPLLKIRKPSAQS